MLPEQILRPAVGCSAPAIIKAAVVFPLPFAPTIKRLSPAETPSETSSNSVLPVGALEKQLGHLDPALRYARDKREHFPVNRFLKEASNYYRTRFENLGIELCLICQEDFGIFMNRGKLIQVLDNLVLNSEYWVKRFREEGSGEAASVTITIQKPCILVQDSAKGIEPAFEETLFDPFITAKPRGEGRGLGLFIATQLLELDGCTLVLLPERNQCGRGRVSLLIQRGCA